jgi:nucleoside-diphosphate-sugar epimerase
VGRNLVKYLIDNNLASDIRVADKKAKFMAFLSADHKAAMEHEMVECIQADCSDDEHLDKVLAEARSGGAFDYVVNCAAETDHTKAESFMAKIPDIAAKLGRGAAAMGVKKFVQVSTAFVYAAGAKPSAEGSKLGPWTTQAEYMLKAEEALRSIAGLPLVVLRPAIIYGPGDAIGLMPRAVIAAAYKRMKEEKMEFLWGPDLKLNTVHVFDVVRAVYFAARKVEAGTSEWSAIECEAVDRGAERGRSAAAVLGAVRCSADESRGVRRCRRAGSGGARCQASTDASIRHRRLRRVGGLCLRVEPQQERE